MRGPHRIRSSSASWAGEAYNYRLGATLRMERTILEILEVNVRNAENGLVIELLGSHLEESRAHVPAVESAFSLMGVGYRRLPVTIVDSIILQDTAEIEHYEIGGLKI